MPMNARKVKKYLFSLSQEQNESDYKRTNIHIFPFYFQEFLNYLHCLEIGVL